MFTVLGGMAYFLVTLNAKMLKLLFDDIFCVDA